jgi:hypothetical protein
VFLPLRLDLPSAMLPPMTDPDPAALAAAWRDRLRDLDFAAFAAAVREQPGLSVAEMVGLDEAVSNAALALGRGRFYRLLAAHLAAWLAPGGRGGPERVRLLRPDRAVPSYLVADELGANPTTLTNALSPERPKQRATAERLYRALAERDAVRADALTDDLLRELFRPRWGLSR